MNQDVQIKGNFFLQSNALIFRGKPSHSIANLTSPEKNIEIKIIVVSRQGNFRTKKGQIAQFLVADESGCIYMNFFNSTGVQIEQGDILYVSGAYTSFYKDSLLIYQGSCSFVRRVGRWYSKFNIDMSSNISLNKSLIHGGKREKSESKG